MPVDNHRNFAYSTVATAPVPADSGTSLIVQVGHGARFPTVPFNATVWPTAVQPSLTNAEIVRVTNITADTLTITRTQEVQAGSINRSIVIGDQIAATITAKTLTDAESLTVNDTNNFRLSLTSGTPVTTADVSAATTLYCTPGGHGNRIVLFDSAGGATGYTSAEFSIPVPASTSQMYDVFCYANAGVPTLEALAWTNDTTRATPLVLTTTGARTKSGDLTRRFLASVRTTTVNGQTEDSDTKRYLWNHDNRVLRRLRRVETTASWTYTTATIRQARASTDNQVDCIIGVVEDIIDLSVCVGVTQTNAGLQVAVGIGKDSTTTFASHGGTIAIPTASASQHYEAHARLVDMPTVGRHFYSWNEYSEATPTTTWYGTATLVANGDYGIFGFLRG